MRRLLLKLSGEALAGATDGLFHLQTLNQIVNAIKTANASGIEIGIVIGAGNIVRGKQLAAAGFERNAADNMGMLGTMINATAVQQALQQQQVDTAVMSALPVTGIGLCGFDSHQAKQSLANGQVLILPGGIGSSLFSTDTAACVRAIQLQADMVLKATKVNGVFAADPIKDKNAKHYPHISYATVLQHKLGVMDQTAITLCQEHALPVRVFALAGDNLLQVMQGQAIGSLIDKNEDNIND